VPKPQRNLRPVDYKKKASPRNQLVNRPHPNRQPQPHR